MSPFTYQRAASVDEALQAVRLPHAQFLGGGTNLVDLMKSGAVTPAALVDVSHLPNDPDLSAAKRWDDD